MKAVLAATIAGGRVLDLGGNPLPGAGVSLRYLPNTTDWLGRFQEAYRLELQAWVDA